jgi:hypothetical protein
MKPKYTINAHFSRLKLIPNLQHFKKQSHILFMWVSMLLKIVKSSKKIFMNKSMYSWNVLFTTRWSIDGPFSTLNGLNTQTNISQSIAKIVLY